MQFKYIVFFLLFILSSTIHGQETNSYYAIDGTKYNNKEDRDIFEELLLADLENNIVKMNSKGQFKTDETYINLNKEIEQVLLSIKSLRNLTTTYMPYLRKDQIIHFEQRGITIENGYAQNGEWFVLKEFSDAFDIVLNEFWFLYNLTESMNKKELETIQT